MPEATKRIRRLISNELGDCLDEDVEKRMAEIEELADRAFENDATREVFAVLGNETRYRIARALATSEEERCVCELEPLVEVSNSAVSHALSDLVDGGLVHRRKEGNWRYYRSTKLAESLFMTADAQVATNE